jgi:protein-tyrosine phosphatase
MANEIGLMLSCGAQTHEMFEILPHLYFSKFPSDIPSNITHVLNMCTTPNPPEHTREYLHIPILDIDNIMPHIFNIVEFIDSALQDYGNHSNVLVHCALGINRSAAAIVAYLCHRNNLNTREVLNFSKKKG